MKKIKSLIKRLIYFLKLGGIINKFRRAKYALLDLFGTIFLAAARSFKFVPVVKTYDENKVKKILIVRNDRVGDLVLSTPALRALRKKYFDAKIHLLVNDYAKDLVINNPNIDKILIEAKEVLNIKYDLAIALHAGFKQNQILFQSQADCRIGFVGAGGGFFLTEKIKDDRRENPQHEIDFTLKAAQKAGADIEDKKLEVSLTAQGEAFAEKFYGDNQLSGMTIIVHPGARQESLRWPKHSFAQLADLLIEQLKMKVVLTGTAKEKELISDILCEMKSKPAVCVDVKLTELVSVMKRGSIYVGNITGPMHIACALNIPVVAITGLFDSLDDIRYWGPRCDKFEIVRKQGMEAITVDDVYQAVLRLAGKNDT